MFLNSGLGGDRRRPEARPPGHRPARDHRLPRRLPRPDVRRDLGHDLVAQLPDRLRAAPAGRLPRPVPGGLPATSTATRRAHPRPAWRACARCSTTVIAAVDRSAAILIEPVQGEGGYTPAPAAFLRGPPRDLRRARDPARSPTRSRPATAGPAGCGPSSTPGSCPDVVVHRQGDRERPAALGDRHAAGAAGPLGQGRPRLDVRRQSGRLRGRRSPSSRRSRDEGLVANAAARGAELRAGLARIAAEDERIGDVRGPGLMIGVEFVTDRGHAGAGRRARRTG